MKVKIKSGPLAGQTFEVDKGGNLVRFQVNPTDPVSILDYVEVGPAAYLHRSLIAAGSLPGRGGPAPKAGPSDLGRMES